jgi:hypothetical protein
MPVELDSSPAVDKPQADNENGKADVVGLGEEEDIEREFLGERGEVGVGKELREVCHSP